jgi:glycosyltransferase involved in cell wall biosynthesis
MKSGPLVSVLMTAYNREKYIGEAIASVRASTLEDWELIVVDDASRDRTVEVAREAAVGDPRIRILVNPENLTDYRNRNRAASLARGKYLKYVDSDDMIYPHGLEVMTKMMERFPCAGLGLSSEGEDDRIFPIELSPVEAYRIHFLRRELFGRAPGSAIIRREAFEAVGGFSGARYIGDSECWLKICKTYPLVLLPRDLVWDRTHGQQEKIYMTGKDVKDYSAAAVGFEARALKTPGCPMSESEIKQALQKRKKESFKNAALCFLRGRWDLAFLKWKKSMEWRRF